MKFFFRAIAASAPVAQFDAPCDAFGRIVTADYTAQGAFCSQTIRRSWAAIDNVTSTGKDMVTSILTGFSLRLTSPVQVNLNKTLFI